MRNGLELRGLSFCLLAVARKSRNEASTHLNSAPEAAIAEVRLGLGWKDRSMCSMNSGENLPNDLQ